MKKPNPVIPKERLYGIVTILIIFETSRSTINRKISAGLFPPPDIKGGSGRPNKWFKSTIDQHLDSLKTLGEVA